MHLLAQLGGEDGCRRLAAEFYGRVALDPLLCERLFPGKTLRCATEEFAAFLIQFLGGDEDQTQKRWWLSLRASHARFRITDAERQAWLRHMTATLEALQLPPSTREALIQFFGQTSEYVRGHSAAAIQGGNAELTSRWRTQLELDHTIAAIETGQIDESLRLIPHFAPRTSVYTGLLAKLLQRPHPAAVKYVVDAITQDPARMAASRFAGRYLLHYAAAAGCLPVVDRLLSLPNADANLLDSGGHPPLYAAANSGAGDSASVVRALVRAGAQVDHCGAGVMRTTPLHMAARRGNLAVARALVDCGASLRARDKKGATPLDRARSCRQAETINLLTKLAESR